MAKTKGCEVAKRYSEFIKFLLKLSLDNDKEVGAVFCAENGEEPKLGHTSVGNETYVTLPSCPPGQESIGTIHTHLDGLDFFSTADFLSFAAKDDEFACLAYLDEHGEPYVKCIHRPDNIGEWLDKMDVLQKLEDEVSDSYVAYNQALSQVVSAVEEEGELSNKAAIIKELRKRRDEFIEKLKKLREKAIELEPDACVVKL